ncbi:hypothetical protein ACJRO7_009597 [Eucalyptus globulus]|uniref:Uncharacterized protein n=1 Tax=Eucalyptus globulus TaxID=34317 RepID=A0ABD3LA20_EUCGL
MGNLMKLKGPATDQPLPPSTVRKSLRSASVSKPTSPPTPLVKRPSSLPEVLSSPLEEDKDQTAAFNFDHNAGRDSVLSDSYFSLDDDLLSPISSLKALTSSRKVETIKEKLTALDPTPPPVATSVASVASRRKPSRRR